MDQPLTILIDCGHSRVKLALADAAGHLSVLPNLTALPAVLPTAMAQAMTTGGVLAHVGPAAQGALLATWCAQHGGRLRVVGADLPLPDLGQYASCGADRVLAGLGALRLKAQDQIVIDAGTAVTFSAWRAEAGRPRFAGGMILPGAVACGRGLVQAAPRLAPFFQPDALAGAALDVAQHDSTGAITAALQTGHPAMVRACAQALVTATGIQALTLTGGGADSLRPALAEAQPQPQPGLVLAGLAALAVARPA